MCVAENMAGRSPDSSAELLAFVSINMAENVLKSHQTSGLSGLSGLFDGS